MYLQLIKYSDINNSIYLISDCQNFFLDRGHLNSSFRCLNHPRIWAHLYGGTELSPKCPCVKSWYVKHFCQFDYIIVFN